MKVKFIAWMIVSNDSHWCLQKKLVVAQLTYIHTRERGSE
jgi:hypothetical protein